MTMSKIILVIFETIVVCVEKFECSLRATWPKKKNRKIIQN